MRFYFAWVNETDNTFLTAFKREDAFIYDFNLSQTEGDFASLEITIDNPRRGLLHGFLWAWFAYEHPTAGTVPLFFGRLVGVPDDTQANYVKLTFIARPSDFEVQKLLLAQSLCARPFWDPIWFDATKPFDPDNVLESRTQLWYTNPVTHVVSASDIINGEDGNIALNETNVFYDSVSIRYGQPPVRAVNMTATVSWKQIAQGVLDVSEKIPTIQSYTGEGLILGWPKVGDNIGGGWSVAASGASADFFQSPATTFQPGFAIPEMERTNGLPFEYFTLDDLFQPHGGLVFCKGFVNGTLVLGYDAKRDYSEVLNFTLVADTQAVVVDPAGQDVVDISLSSSEVSQAVDPAGATPLTSPTARRYFSTDRGAQSIEYLIAVARARLLARARCVDIQVEIPFQDAIALGVSLRKNAVFTDHHIPGGVATGKIKEFRLSLSGDDGKATAQLTIASTVGAGNSVVGTTGTPEYVEAAYVDPNYQVYDGAAIAPMGDVLYGPVYSVNPNDDGIDFDRLSEYMVLRSLTVNNPVPPFPLHGPTDAINTFGTWSQYYLTQDAIIGLPGWTPQSYRPEYSPADAIKELDNYKTTIDLKLRSLDNGPFQTTYSLTVSDLMIPRLIDLEASSS